MSKLEIPEQAIRLGDQAYMNAPPSYEMADALKVAGPIIAAAELRRLAERFMTESRRPISIQELATSVVVMLQERADELDPQGTEGA